MPRRFPKKNAKTFELVHRSHDDAHFYDEEAHSHVLVEKPKGKNNKGKIGAEAVLTKNDLDAQLKDTVRQNEGMAAQYGIFYDDSKYDYMQHLRPMGKGDMYIEKKEEKPQGKRIEDLFDQTQLPQEKERPRGFIPRNDIYELIPQEIRGFQPDMDPRLREVLEALEDEAYVEEESGDVFEDLLKSGEAEDDDFYDEWDDEFDYEQDEFDYDKNYDEDQEFEDLYNDGEAPEGFDPEAAAAAANAAGGDWQRDFAQFKRNAKNKDNDWDSDDEFDEDGNVVEEEEEEEEDQLGELPTFKKQNKTKQRKKKGAMTDTSLFSMLSLALFRTEGLAMLDDRFEVLNKKYDDEEPEEYTEEFNMENERDDLESMLDEFLDNYELDTGGRKLVKKDEEHDRMKAAAKQLLRSEKKPKITLAFARMNLS